MTNISLSKAATILAFSIGTCMNANASVTNVTPSLSVNDPFLQLFNVGVNSDGFTAGQRIRFGADAVVPNGSAGTTGTATTTNTQTGAAVSRTITFDPSPVSPNMFTRTIAYDSGLVGPWTLGFQSPGYAGYSTTLTLPNAQETPFVNSITLTGTASNPTFSWTPPTATVVNGYRINIYDKSLINTNASAGPLNSGIVVSQNLQPNVTSFTVNNSAFTVPGYGLTTGKQYSIEIDLLQTRDGLSSNLSNGNVDATSRVYADFTPLANGNAPAVNLPVTLANGSFQYNIVVVAGQTYYIDPAVAAGYRYAIGTGDPDFASVLLPGVQADPFDISFFDGTNWVTDQVLANVVFDFPTGGVDAFTVTGIDAADGLDPNSTTAFVTALTFVGSGTFTGTQTAIVTTTVPEPSLIALLAIGLAACAARHLRKPRGTDKPASRFQRSNGIGRNRDAAAVCTPNPRSIARRDTRSRTASSSKRSSGAGWLAGSLLAVMTPAWADADRAALDGTWTVSYGSRVSTLVVAGGTGTIRYLSTSQGQGKNPCVGRTFPVAITVVDGELSLAVNASGVMQGCEDMTLKVVVGDDKAPVGTFPNGRTAQFTRQ